MSVKDLINAIATGNAIETQEAFQSVMAEKISARLDDMRVEVAQNMFKEEVDIEESAAARFNKKVKQAHSAHEAGDHKKAKYHLDTARSFMPGINSNDHSKIKDSYSKYKELRGMHKEEFKLDISEEEVEELDELSSNTLNNYRTKANKAGYNSKTTQQKLDNRSKSMNLAWSKTMPPESDETNPNKAKVKAGDYKFNKEEVEELYLEDYSLEELEDFMMSEDFEQLDELSKATLGSYVKKASADSRDKALDVGIEMQSKPTMLSAIQKFNKSAKRVKGVSTAVDKLAK